jgi:hypothetical protein
MMKSQLAGRGGGNVSDRRSQSCALTFSFCFIIEYEKTFYNEFFFFFSTKLYFIIIIFYFFKRKRKNMEMMSKYKWVQKGSRRRKNTPGIRLGYTNNVLEGKKKDILYSTLGPFDVKMISVCVCLFIFRADAWASATSLFHLFFFSSYFFLFFSIVVFIVAKW